MIYITYKDLVVRFGRRNAHDLMLCVERLAKIQDGIVTPFDQEQRMHRALMALNDVGCAAQEDDKQAQKHQET